MKKNAKILALMLALILTLTMGLTACGGADDSDGPIGGCYVCDKTSVYLNIGEDNSADAIVVCENSAQEKSSWLMRGTFDSRKLQFKYDSCVRTDYKFSETGDTISNKEVYNDGSGVMTVTKGEPNTLTWEDEKENFADGMIFEYTEEELESESTGMANPWSDVDSAEAAAEGAGFEEFSVPEGAELSLGELAVSQYRCMEGMAEAEVEYPAVAMTIRKGYGDLEIAEGDISGDYNEYEFTWTQNIDGLEVQCFGNREGEAAKTIWSMDDIDYSITAYGLGGDEDYGLQPDDLTILVNGIQ